MTVGAAKIWAPRKRAKRNGDDVPFSGMLPWPDSDASPTISGHRSQPPTSIPRRCYHSPLGTGRRSQHQFGKWRMSRQRGA